MEPPTEKSRLKVLLADDEWLVCWSLKRRLLRLGLDVVTVATGSEALNLLRETAVDWLVTDLKMPDLDGFELIAAAQRIQPGVRTLLMTSYGSPSVEEQARLLGAVYVPKPFDLDHIAAILLPVTPLKQ